MKTRMCLLLSVIVLVLGTSSFADILELKNGTILNGKYMGGTAGTLRFDAGKGMQVIPTPQIIALTFTSPAGGVTAQPQAAPPPAKPVPTTPAPPPAQSQARTITLPTGTMLLVRMMDSISSNNRVGSTFTTKLEYDLVVGTSVALKGGTKIYGKVMSSTQARRAIGRSTLDIRLTQLMINGKLVPFATSGYKAAGEASIKKAARGAAAGAIIGSVADGSDGAGKGAAIGATLGALRKGETVTITPGALLEFNLAQPLKLSISGGQVAQPIPPAPARPPTVPTRPPAQVAAIPSTPPPGSTRTITLPTGTMLLVRMMDSISSRNKAGSTFTTKLEYDLVVGDSVALTGGTKIYGKVKSSTQARRAIGRSTLDIRLTQLMINGKPVPFATSGYEAAGEASIKKAARGALAGAAIGAIADGSKGAGKGAAIGGTLGALRKGQTVTIPPGALLEFNLAQPLELSISG